MGYKLHPLGFLIAVPYFLLLSAVMSAVRGIFTVALYRYATGGRSARRILDAGISRKRS